MLNARGDPYRRLLGSKLWDRNFRGGYLLRFGFHRLEARWFNHDRSSDGLRLDFVIFDHCRRAAINYGLLTATERLDHSYVGAPVSIVILKLAHRVWEVWYRRQGKFLVVHFVIGVDLCFPLVSPKERILRVDRCCGRLELFGPIN